MYYPIMVDLTNKRVTIIGGGKVAYRKCRSLLDCCNKIIAISQEFIDDFQLLEDKIMMIHDGYNEKYIINNYLVIAATDSVDINSKIAVDCKKTQILCNVVNNTDLSDYIVPTVVRRSDLIMAISTSGKSPSLSKKIKGKLEEDYPMDYAEYVDLLGRIREIIINQDKYKNRKKQILNSLVDMNHMELEQYHEYLIREI